MLMKIEIHHRDQIVLVKAGQYRISVSVWNFQLVLIMSIIMLLVPSCNRRVWLDRVDLAPDELVRRNDEIAVCNLVGADTCVTLGPFESDVDPSVFHIIAYRFEPIERIKTTFQCEGYCILYLARQDLRTGYSSALRVSSLDTALIYGDNLQSWSDILSIIYTHNGVNDVEMKKLLDGASSGKDWFGRQDDSCLAVGLVGSQVARDAVTELLTLENVCLLYGTDRGYMTHHSYSRGHVGFVTADNKGPKDEVVTSQEYLSRLRMIVQKDDQSISDEH